ncbi:septal ring lytic transglycosylase RlpA family protein [Xylophilus rhododendri]|uniref:Endolytic peptidoglycan transglycosylase RlpA n=1 Tax=Xylophilus rhododendri TaxID=2697032 RepID=A0A857J4A1_9BURK|nr:septal ring lytic transglycosylase RlpA family protein [Xylophilus rhododendri]QHI98780.1 septal ring lytic transglycosylase RlpA family protein [Xylophilus rhododendri]
MAAVLAALLAGCASKPGGGARPGRDGPDANPPTNLSSVPDAEPRSEAIRAGGPNKPYVVLGRAYSPLDPNASYRESGLASWYGRKFHGASTSSGEPYDMYAMTAAHTTLPIPSYARVRNPANGREVIVRVNDRGPFHDGRIIDLSYTAAYKLDLLRGVAPVEVERITPVEIASGSWRRGNTGTALAQAAPPPPAPMVQVPSSAVASVAYAQPAPPPPPAPAQSLTVYTPPAVEPGDTAGFTAVPLPAEARSADQDGASPPPPRSIVVTTLPALAPASPAAASPAPAPVAGPADMAAAPPPAESGFWVQLGAFARPEGASALARRAGDAGTTVSVLQDGALKRVQAGPYPSREAARDAARRLGEALQLAPVVVERH